MPPRAKSAYFIFCDANREKARETCLAELGTEKVSVAVVAKKLGELWKAQSTEERDAYKALAKQQTEASEQPDQEEAHEAEGGEEDAAKPAMVFPLTSIKRIMKLDKNVNGISKGAVEVIAKAAELALQNLVEEASRVAASRKRTKIVFADVEAVLEQDPRWQESGILNLLKYDPRFNGGKVGAGQKKKKVELDPQAQSITKFFHA